MIKSDIHILIVDDVSDLRAFLTGYLKHFGYFEIYQAKDGIDAMQQISKRHMDVVFLDIEMPKQNGIETLKLIHQQSPNTFVIMLSCHSSLGNVKEAIKHGASGFIVKPFNAEKVTDALSHFIKSYDEKVQQAKDKQKIVDKEEKARTDVWGNTLS